ncbi:ferritin light chain-like [Bos javanicus]|uniref:ferritin light chain-like n=1 Tax=Bos javanicus TaxID=9906 RepID=UPI002AA66927|nr:ferritin light chain-like [Bos javanicus]
MSFQILLDFQPRGGGHHPVPCGPASSSLPYLPVSGLPFQLQSVALDDLGEFFSKLALEKLQGTNTLSQMQKQSSGHAPFPEVEKPSQDEWGGARDALEATLLIEKNLKQALLGLCGLFSACADPRFCRFLEVCFLNKVVKIIRKMGDHLTDLRGPTGPQAGQGKYLTCRTPAAFEE